MRITAATPVHFLKSVWANLVYFLRFRKLRASKDVVEIRNTTCSGCVFFDSDTGQCLECTCFIEMKAQLAAEKCPHGFW